MLVIGQSPRLIAQNSTFFIQAAKLLGISNVEAELEEEAKGQTIGQGNKPFNKYAGLGAKGPTKHQVFIHFI